jgi:putative DNA primase/helicase
LTTTVTTMARETVPDGLLTAALEYAERGWPVLPLHSPNGDGGCSCGNSECRSPAKHPRTINGLKDATTDETTIRKWWRRWPSANIGSTCGPTSFIALDLDRHGDQDGPAVARAKFGWEPEGPVSRTGGGGYHQLCRHPGGHVKSRCGKNAIEAGVELKGDRSYIVAPPSIHASGRAYTWLYDPDCEPLAELPGWAVDGQHPRSPAEPGTRRVAEGGRNNHLCGVAGAMRGKGMAVDAVRAAVLAENAAVCDPPLTEDEIDRTIMKSAANWPVRGADQDVRNHVAEFVKGNGPDAHRANPGRQSLVAYPMTDSGMAEILAHLRGGEFLYDHTTGRWLEWAGHWWTEDRDGAVHRAVLICARELQRAIVDEVVDKDQKEARFRKAIGYENRTRLEAVIACARNTPPFATTGDDFNAAPVLFGVANGVVDLQTGRLRDGQPADRITTHTEIPFHPEATCPRFDQFLDEVMLSRSDLIDWLWRAVGYSLTGDTDERLLFLLYGRGANGKSVLLCILRYVAGGHAANMAFQALELGGRTSISNDIADLRGKRLVTASETNEATRLNVARLKALAGGSDAMTGRRLYENNMTFDPQCHLWLAVNDKPIVRDDSDAFWDRLRLLPFERRFEAGEKDVRLVERLRAEAPGILAWAIRGAVEYYRRGLDDTPQCVRTAVQDYQQESDPLAGFLDDACVVRDGLEVGAADFYNGYRDWAEQNKLREREILTRTAFGRLAGKRFVKKPTRSGKVYHGVGIRHQWRIDVPD